MEILIIKNPITKTELERLAKNNYGNMIKGVVDVEKDIIALGGELHADSEAVLLQQGSVQENLWGFNIYTDQPKNKKIEYTSFINIRPSQNNNSLEVQDKILKNKIKNIINRLVGD